MADIRGDVVTKDTRFDDLTGTDAVERSAFSHGSSDGLRDNEERRKLDKAVV